VNVVFCCSLDCKVHLKFKKKVNATYTKKKMLVNGDVVHADQGCHGIVLWPWDVNFSMPYKKN